MKPTCGWLGISSSTAKLTSSRRPPKPCVGSSSTTPGRSGPRKRGDRRVRADLDPDQLPAGGFDPDRWIDLDEALTRFAAIDHAAAELAKLRVFGGLSVEEAGEALGIPRPTAFRIWTYARAWFTARLADGSGK